MSATSGPDIIKNGLVFAFDPGDERSLVGEPTTNIITNASSMSGWSNYYRTISSSQFLTDLGTTGYKFTNQPSWNGVSRSITVPSTGTYTFSAWIKYLGGSVANNGATVYVAGHGGPDIATLIDKTKIGVWQRISLTFSTTNTNFSLFLISYGGTDNGTGNPDWSSWEVTMPQLEAKTYPTPFINGTRNTANDVSPNRSVLTVNSFPLFLSNNNGSLRFDGIDDFITNNNTSANIANGFFADSASSWSVSTWFKFPISPTQVRDNVVAGGNCSYTIISKAGGIATGATFILFVGGSTTAFGSNQNKCTVGIRGANTAISSLNVNTNTWNNAVVTWDGTTARGYLNNSSPTTLTVGTAIIQEIPINVGTANSSTNIHNFEGEIGTCYAYNRALSQLEINKNFNALRSRFGV